MNGQAAIKFADIIKSRRNTRKSLKTWWDKFYRRVSKYAFPSVILVGSQKT